MILPGKTLGMLGGGQLGRMFTVAARTMGYEVIVLDPDPHSPAGQLASDHICAAYDDPAALAKLAACCDAITTEFENVPGSVLDELAATTRVRPGAAAVTTTQDRIAEKSFLRDNGFATAPFAVVRNDDDLAAALAAIPAPAILKVARFGYDGKGQYTIHNEQELREAWRAVDGTACVLEQRVKLDCEVSVVLARGDDGEVVPFPLAENVHRNGILDVTSVPARVAPAVSEEALATASRLATALDYVGVMAVEFFLSDGRLLVNEIAPRPHNSGHYTEDACATSQFEQQVRALCGLPLGDARLLTPVAMVNLLGDVWPGGSEPAWQAVMNEPTIKLHLYGKREARPGRKMGHFNVLDADLDAALERARAVQGQLLGD